MQLPWKGIDMTNFQKLAKEIADNGIMNVYVQEKIDQNASIVELEREIKLAIKMIKRLRLGDYLGSLLYAGQCDTCHSQFMSNWDWVYFIDDKPGRYCSEKCCQRVKT
jgi:hypothetical protein